jgi:predicted nucleic-acid-binding Zn-ribbon protein
MKEPRILFWDIESCPNTYAQIGVLPEYSGDRPGLTLKADVNSLMCFGYKFLGDKKSSCINVWDTVRGRKDINDDLDILKASREILESADLIVTHYGKGFDLKFFNTRLLIRGLKPLPDIPHVDTKMLASSKLFMMKNRLDYLAEKLGTARKVDNGGWGLWLRLSHSSQKGPRCPSAEQTRKDKALMTKYCKGDVEALEKLFLKLRPFAKGIPNYNLFKEGGPTVCPSCGSTNVHKNGTRATRTGRKVRLRCNDCGSSSYEHKKLGLS